MKFDPINMGWWEAHELVAGSITPRPIAFVSTISEQEVFNVAPFSFFSPICVKPLLIGFSIGRKEGGNKKDTLINIEYSKDFVVNVITETLAEPMNQASRSYPYYVDEFKEVGLTPVKADMVKSPMVAESPINLECRLIDILEFGEAPRLNNFIIGEVVRVHVKDEVYTNDEIQPFKLNAVGRLGGEFYCRTRDVFKMKRPEELSKT